jgi:DNA-binding beta-propeller fold protein YncE/DNA-directed RNA polymerase subunit RPC12/RpoP
MHPGVLPEEREACMAIVFKCPSCGGDIEVASSDRTTTCRYCGSSVLVPEEMVSAPGVPVRETVVVRGGSRSAAGCLVAGLAGLLVIVAALGVFLFAAVKEPSVGKPQDLLLRFGSGGTGSGSFTDARNLALDAAGRIYVAEYGSGRVQVFDTDGSFECQWFVPGDPGSVYIHGIDATPDGRLLVVVDGGVGVFDGLTGEMLGTLHPVFGFTDVYVCGDGSILAPLWSARNDIYRFAPSGEIDLLVEDAFRDVTTTPELSPIVAADGMGGIYVLGVFNSAVFVFDRNGNYLDRFGSMGQEPGQLLTPSDMVVDDLGRLYISDMGGVKVFEPDGRFLGLIEPPGGGFVFGMDFGPDGNLYMVTSNEEVVATGPFQQE